jgi:predicted metal-binding membrane protein
MSVAALLRRQQQVTLAALALVIALALGYVLLGAGMGMTALDMTLMRRDMDMAWPAWSPSYALTMFAMWWAMMVAMMLPSAVPVILLAAALNAKAQPGRPPYGATAWFVAGYLVAWGGFSIAAVAAQWWLSQVRALAPMLHLRDAHVAASLLVAAGLWQFTPWKRACLQQCRSPLAFLTQRRRAGSLGALVMGLEHGGYCLRCCWLLMALLFVGGVMNLFWIGGLALIVLVEKALPAGQRFARALGAVLLICGLAVVMLSESDALHRLFG